MIKTLDMHVHTEISWDSSMKLDAIERYLKRRPEMGFVITDHNEIKGAMMLKDRLPQRIIVGEEIRTAEGEVSGLFLKERIPPGKSIDWTLDAILVQGGLIYVPHPLDRMRTSKLTPEGLQAALKRADILEVYNARNIFPADDQKAYALADERELLKGCGSDAHTAMELGRSYVQFERPIELTPEELLEGLERASLKRRRSFIGVHFVTKYRKIRARR